MRKEAKVCAKKNGDGEEMGENVSNHEPIVKYVSSVVPKKEYMCVSLLLQHPSHST